MPPTIVKLDPMPAPYATAASPVLLDACAGEGHKGRLKVSLDGTELTKADEVKALTVGTGAELVGKTLQVLATVTLTNTSSSRTSVTCTLSGGASPGTFVLDGPTATIGDTVDFQAKFLFT